MGRKSVLCRAKDQVAAIKNNTLNTGKVLILSLGIVTNTVEPPNKGHFGANSFVPCREVVPISEVK